MVVRVFTGAIAAVVGTDASVMLSGVGGMVFTVVAVAMVPGDEVHPAASITAVRTRIRNMRRDFCMSRWLYSEMIIISRATVTRT